MGVNNENRFAPSFDDITAYHGKQLDKAAEKSAAIPTPPAKTSPSAGHAATTAPPTRENSSQRPRTSRAFDTSKAGLGREMLAQTRVPRHVLHMRFSPQKAGIRATGPTSPPNLTASTAQAAQKTRTTAGQILRPEIRLATSPAASKSAMRIKNEYAAARQNVFTAKKALISAHKELTENPSLPGGKLKVATAKLNFDIARRQYLNVRTTIAERSLKTAEKSLLPGTSPEADYAKGEVSRKKKELSQYRNLLAIANNKLSESAKAWEKATQAA